MSADERARDVVLLHLDDENRRLKDQLRALQEEHARVCAKAETSAGQLTRLRQQGALLDERKALLVDCVLRRSNRQRLQLFFGFWRAVAETTDGAARALSRAHNRRQRAVLAAWRLHVARKQHAAWACIRVVATRRRHSLRLAFEAWSSWCLYTRRRRRALAAARRLRLRRVVMAWRLLSALEVSRRWAVQHDADARALAAARTDVEEAQERLKSSHLLADECCRQRDAAQAALLRAELRSPAMPGAPFLDAAMKFSVMTPGGVSSMPRQGGALCPAAFVSASQDGTYEDVVLLVANTAQPTAAVLRSHFGVDVSPDMVVAHGTHREWLPCILNGAPPRCTEWAACGLGALGVLCVGGFDGHREQDQCYLVKAVRGMPPDATASSPVQHFQWEGPLTVLSGTPRPRSHATLSAAPGSALAYLFGGHSSSCGALNELWCVSVSQADGDGSTGSFALTWYRPHAVGQPPSPRTGHAACVSPHDGCLYVFGGLGVGTSGHRVLNDLHRFDPATGAWECIRPWGPQPPPRRLHAMSAVGAHLIIHGGTTDDGVGVGVGGSFNADTNDCYALDLTSMTWRNVALAGPVPGVKAPTRSAHTMVIGADGALMVLGGVVNGRVADDFAPCCIENAAAAEGLALRREALNAAKFAAVSAAARRDAVASAAAALSHAAVARREALHARAEADDARVRLHAAIDTMHALVNRVHLERARRKTCVVEHQVTRRQVDALSRELQRRTAALESAVTASDADAMALAEALAARDSLAAQIEALRRERDAAAREALVASAAAAAAEAARGAAELRAEQARKVSE